MTASTMNPLEISTRGTAFIEASAGTGKTYAITSLYVRLLLEGRADGTPLSVQQILVVTFTDAATAELRLRVRARLRQMQQAIAGGTPTGETDVDELLDRRKECRVADLRTLTVALQDFDEAAISTIHGFCQRVLRENAFESGVPFDVALVTTQTELVGDIVRDFWVREMAAAPAVLVRYAQDHGVRVGTLETLARRVLAHRRIRVLPEIAVDRGGGEAAIEEWRRCRNEVARLWAAEGKEVIDLLCSSDALNRNSYRQASIRTGWVRGIDALLSSEVASWTDMGWFDLLTTAGMAERTRKGRVPPQSAFFAACSALQAAEESLRVELEARLVQLRLDFVEFVRAELHRRKAAANVHYFDDLVHGLEQALEREGSGAALAAAIRERFPVALIDEFQDTDPSQYAIFEIVYGGRPETRMLVGDPKQAIYTFRGADVYAYLAARSRVSSPPHRLGTNRRSSPDLVRAINTVFRRHGQPFGVDIPFEDAEPARTSGSLRSSGELPAPLRILFVERPRPEPGSRHKPVEVLNKGDSEELVTRPVAAEITRLLAGGFELDDRQLAPGDIAVLCRTNRQVAEMQGALRNLGVPSVLQSAGSVFATAEATEVRRVVTALASPGSGNAVRAALATDMLGVTALDLLRFDSDPEAWDGWLVRWRRWHDLWLQRGFLPAFRRLLDETGAAARLLSFPDGERRLTNVLHLGELVHRAEADGLGGPDGLDEWLRAMRQDDSGLAELGDDAAQMRLESDADAVKLVTVHKSKGLEYPVVFCPYLWDGNHFRDEDKRAPRFHDDARRLCVDLGSAEQEGNIERARAESLAESVRLLYVALTRAREHCVVVWGAFREATGSALARVFHGVGADDPGAVKLGNDAELQADLQALVEAGEGAISLEPMRGREPVPYAPAAPPPTELHCRRMARTVRVTRSTASFSWFVDAPRVPAAEVGRDDDSADEEVTDVGAGAAAGAGVVSLAAFPRGTRAGQMVHRIFEQLDFAAASAETIAAVVRAESAAEGMEDGWEVPLTTAIAEVLDTPLRAPHDVGSGVFTLRGVGPDRCLKEMEFVFPIGGDENGPGLTCEGLAAVFERHGAPSPDPAAAAALRNLGFGEVRGFLRGFVDLIFEQDGRWYVVDWKSNSLGYYPDDYAPARLLAAMRRHHYYLQYHLYVVALHKYLGVRLPDYEYERHFGGVYYLFLRGMGGPSLPGNGVYLDRPSAALVHDLSALLAAGSGGGER
ncbi:exodeoxyribonuclease V subunit beta [Candidatus Binatia bacterium]|nr:exodeoxyribonuclease V subunit beta [Candidatus Binatia bacterium]